MTSIFIERIKTFKIYILKVLESLIIKWKEYHIWDEIIVCVDSADKSNYIFDM